VYSEGINFQTILFCAGVEDRATMGSDPIATCASYSILAVTSVLPASYDYAGAHNAMNLTFVRLLLCRDDLFLRRPATEQTGF
jgi:hypothetical protein